MRPSCEDLNRISRKYENFPTLNQKRGTGGTGVRVFHIDCPGPSLNFEIGFNIPESKMIQDF